MSKTLSIDFQSYEFQCNPYKVYKEIRKEHPVYWDKKQRSFFAFSYDAVKKALIDKTFSADCPIRASRTIFGRTIMDVDGDEHTRLRLSANTMFMPHVIPKYSKQIIEPIVTKVIDQIIDKGETDFVRDFANQIPLRVVSKIIGFPEKDFDFFYEKSKWLIAYLDDTTTNGVYEEAKKSIADLSERLIPIIEDNRQYPKDNVISQLIHSIDERQKRPLSNQEIMNMLTLLIPAAADTSSRLIANCLYCLVKRPKLLEEVLANLTLVPSVIEETLRFEPPIHSTIRISTQNTELEGISIPAGSIIHIMFASANRDEKYFLDPDKFNIYRNASNYFSFGGGRHQCMGQALARVEVHQVLSMLFKRIEGFKLVNESESIITGKSFRSPQSLIMRFKKREC